MNIITEHERSYLIDCITDLLNEYDYEWDYNALNDIIDTWAVQKANLIKAFKGHPHYLEGKFMIAFDSNYERVVDVNESKRFSDYLTSLSMDEVAAMPAEVNERREQEGCALLPNRIFIFLSHLSAIAARTISAATADSINEMMPNIHAHAGEKTSRVVNRICTYLGFSKRPDYNKEFAKYADSLSPMTITRHTILSINPLDYLTMSFGNSWASCHTIDKTNRRGMPNSYEGQYSSGTMSYMLDKTSMVFYTISADFNGQEYWDEPKVTRQMFHYGEEKLIQGRLYPQSNDCASDLYTPNRALVQQIIADTHNFPNLWVVKKGTEAACEYVETEGTHYPDYEHFGNCSISRPKGSENEEIITIGATPICVECGYKHHNEDCINCCNNPAKWICEDCGCSINDEEDVYYIHGYPYCRDCVSYCDCCDEYHRGDSHYIEGRDIYVCDSCFDDYYAECEECGENYDKDDMYWCESEIGYVCPECFEESYAVCEECGEVFRREDMIEHNGKYYCEDCYEDEDEDEEEASEAC